MMCTGWQPELALNMSKATYQPLCWSGPSSGNGNVLRTVYRLGCFLVIVSDYKVTLDVKFLMVVVEYLIKAI